MEWDIRDVRWWQGSKAHIFLLLIRAKQNIMWYASTIAEKRRSNDKSEDEMWKRLRKLDNTETYTQREKHSMGWWCEDVEHGVFEM